MAEIAEEEEEWVIGAFKKCVDEEKAWAEYLFKDGSMIGLNDKLLHKYVEWIANRRLKSLASNQSMILLLRIIHFLGLALDFF